MGQGRRLIDSTESHSAVVVDRYPLWVDAVCEVLKRIGVTIAGTAGTAAAAFALIEQEKPDLLIVDPMIEDDGYSPAHDGHGPPEQAHGRDFIQRARDLNPELHVIVLSELDDRSYIVSCLAAGADAYVMKSAYPEDLASAVRQGFRPSVYLASSIAPSEVTPRSEDHDGKSRLLTRRELEILEFVARGTPNAAIAKTLWITEQTVKFHLSNIYRKLNLSNRTEPPPCARRSRPGPAR